MESCCRKHSVAHLLIIYLVVNPFQYIFLNSCTEYFFQFALLEADKFAFVLLLLRIVGSKGIKALEVQKVNDFSRIELYSTLVRERPKTEVKRLMEHFGEDSLKNLLTCILLTAQPVGKVFFLGIFQILGQPNQLYI